MKSISASLALIVVVGLIATSNALPARKRMVYLQQPAAAPYYAGPQRIMYMQYVQPGRTHARSTQAASALVAGESVATGTYLKDCDHAETDVVAAGPIADGIVAESQQGASSVAEAYPEESVQVDIEQNVEAEQVAAVDSASASDDAAKVPRDYNFDAAAAAAPVPEEVPANSYLPANKKVIVELEQSAEEEDGAVAEADEDENENAAADDVEEADAPVVPVAPKYPSARRPVPQKPVKAAKPSKPAKPLPAGTFFPIEFGGTAGGAIAIANSFSTGEGGSATSHAIAYGNGEPARARVRPSKFH